MLKRSTSQAERGPAKSLPRLGNRGSVYLLFNGVRDYAALDLKPQRVPLTLFSRPGWGLALWVGSPGAAPFGLGLGYFLDALAGAGFLGSAGLW